MLDDNDIKKLGDALEAGLIPKLEVSLEERLIPKIAAAVEASLVPRMMEVFATKQDFSELRQDVAGLRESQERMITILDGLLKRVEALNDEYLVLKERDSRYERWFNELAAKVGVTLTP